MAYKKEFEIKDNTFTLFVNERKEKETQPDFTGQGIVSGAPVWVSAWKKSGKKGTFLSCSIQPKEEKKTGYTPKGKTDDFAF